MSLVLISGLPILSCNSDRTRFREIHGIELPPSFKNIRHASSKNGSDWVEISVFEMDDDQLQDFLKSLPIKDDWIRTFKEVENEERRPIDRELAEELLDTTLTSFSGILRHRFNFDSPIGEFGRVTVYFLIENRKTVVQIRTWSD